MASSNRYQVFISYRRDGGENMSRLIEERLEKIGYKVFLDVDALKEGKFDEALYNYINESEDVVVVLPPKGLDRCMSEEDWVRKEIAYSFRHHKNVIPFMMKNFDFPANLPKDIADISTQNGIHESHEYFDKAIEKLVSFLKSVPFRGNASVEQLTAAAQKGDTKAMNDLALRYELGSEEGVHQQRAFAWYQRAAEAGNAAAVFNLADIYEQCSRDITKIMDYSVPIETKGDDSEALQAQLYNKALDLYQQAKEMKFLPASFRLGNLADETRDYAKALEYYLEADPYPAALNALGFYYQRGIAVQADIRQAEAYFRRAAESGYAPAIYNYANLLEHRDPDQSIQLYRSIAFGESAIPEAAYCLGKLHESRGEYIQAANCYRTARDNGITEAEQALKRCQEHSLDSLEGNL